MTILAREQSAGKIATPVAARERIELVDILRGFALLGVLLMNIAGFAGEPFGMANWPGAVDRFILPARDFLIQAKFYSLFSFLFGWGMAIQLARAEARGARFLPLYLRRLLILLAIGVIHSLLIWDGDILTIYAIMGLGLLLFRKCPPTLVLISAGLFLLLAIALQWPGPTMMALRGSIAELTAPLQTTGATASYATGSYADLTALRVQEFGRLPGSVIYAFGNIFAMFLLGLYAGKRQLFRKSEEHLSLFRRVLVIGLVIGVLGNGLFILLTHWPDSPLLQWLPGRYERVARIGSRTIGAPALMLFYVSAIVLLVRRVSWQQRLAPLAPVGRMALTNYLLQSVIATLIFYGYGLGLYGRTGPTFNTVLALILFAAQIRFSAWWLARYRFGPAEWAWRSLTYGRRQPMGLGPSIAGRRPFSGRQGAAILFAALFLVALVGLRLWRVNPPGGEDGPSLSEAVGEEGARPTPIIPALTPVPSPEPANVAVATPAVRPAVYDPSPDVAAGDWAALVETFDVDAALETIERFAGQAYDGRAAGTAGGMAAGETIADEFARYGLQPAAADGDYFQAFPIEQTVLAGMPRLVVETTAGETEEYVLYRDFAPVVYSYMGAGSAEGQVVWANNCEAADFEGLDAVGKVVLCRGDRSSSSLGRHALEHGAAGLLLLAGPGGPPMDFSPVYRETWLPEALTIPTFRISTTVAEDLVQGSDKTVADLSLNFTSFPLATRARLEVSTSGPAVCLDRHCLGRNVLAVLPGRDPRRANEVVILGAHYDHLGRSPDGTVWGGANDNASGLAVLLEIARSWHEQGYVPRRSVLFAAWDAEESGLLGSDYYVVHPSYPLTNTVGVLNLDMVGAGAETLSIDGQGMESQIQAVAATMGISTTLTTIGRSDHAPFLAADVPANMITWLDSEDSVPHYHRPLDKPEDIEPEKLEAVARITELATLSLAEVQPELNDLLARRAAALVQGDLPGFLQTSVPARQEAERRWFAGAQSLEPLSVAMTASDVRLWGETASALVSFGLTYAAEPQAGQSVTRTLTVPLSARFESGADGWWWAGPDLTVAQPAPGETFSVAVPAGVETEEITGIAQFATDQYAALATLLGSPAEPGAALLLYESAEALWADTALDLDREMDRWVEPGAIKLVYSPAITRSHQLPAALAQLALAEVGLMEEEMPWLWHGLAPAIAGAADPKAIQRDNLPRLATALAADEFSRNEATDWAAVDYLRRQLGWEGLGQFIADAGQDGEAAALSAHGLDPAQFDAAWQQDWRSRLSQAQAAVDQVLATQMKAVAANDLAAFLAPVDETVPWLQAEAERRFDELGRYPPVTYNLSGEPLALLEDGDVLARVSLDYELDGLSGPAKSGPTPSGRIQQEVLFRAGEGGLRWAGPPLVSLTGEQASILYPVDELELAQELLPIAEALEGELAGFFGPAADPVVVKLHSDDGAFRASTSLALRLTDEVIGWTAGEAIHLRRQPSWGPGDYRPALAELLARRQLAQIGVTDAWLLRGAATYLAALLGDEALERQAAATLHDLWLGVTHGRTGSLADIQTVFESGDDHQQALALTQAWDATRFLVETYGQDALVALLQAQAGGQTLDEAVQTALGHSLADFELAWAESLGRAHAQPAWIDVAQAFDADKAGQHIAALTAPELAGRAAGSDGAEAAAAYIARQFAAYGLEPVVPQAPPEATTIVTGTAAISATTALAAQPELSYLQPFTIEYATLTAAPRLEIVDATGQAQPFAYREDFLTALSSAPAAGQAEGELVIVQDADYQGMDLSGKIAIRLAPRAASEEMALAMAHGAEGLILLGGADYEKDFLAKSPLPTALSGQETIPVLDLTQPGWERLLEITGMTPADLLKLPAALPLGLQAQMAVPLSPPEVVETANVLGLLPGSDPQRRQEVVILGAHYDHVGDDPDTLLCDGRQIDDVASFDERRCERVPGLAYSGANDNASGVAVLLEIARLWHESGFRPRQSILFAAWGAQEPGEVGAGAFVDSPLFSPATTAGVIVLDGVGGGAGYRLMAQGAWDSEGLMLFGMEMADEALEGHISVSIPTDASDDRVFRAAEVPTLLLTWTQASEENWPDVIADPVEPDVLAITGRILALCLMTMAG